MLIVFPDNERSAGLAVGRPYVDILLCNTVICRMKTLTYISPLATLPLDVDGASLTFAVG